MKRYFLDLKDQEALLRDVDDIWNVDMDLAIEVAAKKHNCTNRQVLLILPRDKFIDYLIHCNTIPDIDNYEFLDNSFNKEWLNNSGSID